MAKTSKDHPSGVKKGRYKSILEWQNAESLTDRGCDFEYEPYKIKFTQPAKKRTYTPDFLLPNGILVETKGWLTAEDRMKHLWIKEQCPHLDIRFVFASPGSKIYKGAKKTYARWADENGFQWARSRIPTKWLQEKKK